MLGKIREMYDAAITADPDFQRKALTTLNKEATALLKAGRYLEAVAAFHKLFAKVQQRNLVHAELYTCFSNRAAGFLQVWLEKSLKVWLKALI